MYVNKRSADELMDETLRSIRGAHNEGTKFTSSDIILSGMFRLLYYILYVLIDIRDKN